MKKTSAASDITHMRWILALSMILVVLFFVFLCALSFRALRRQHDVVQQHLPSPSERVPQRGNGLLGELDSQCGGMKRLPCKPGLLCNAATDGVSEGTCIKDPKAPLSGEIAMQFGESCGLDLPACAPGLYCREDAQRARLTFCAKLNEQAPFVVSMKAEGTSPAEGGYHAKAGTPLSFLVQTTNVDRVEIRSQGKVLGQAKKLEGGVYQFAWPLPASFDGEVRAFAFRGAEFSAAALRVTAD